MGVRRCLDAMTAKHAQSIILANHGMNSGGDDAVERVDVTAGAGAKMKIRTEAGVKVGTTTARRIEAEIGTETGMEMGTDRGTDALLDRDDISALTANTSKGVGCLRIWEDSHMSSTTWSYISEERGQYENTQSEEGVTTGPIEDLASAIFSAVEADSGLAMLLVGPIVGVPYSVPQSSNSPPTDEDFVQDTAVEDRNGGVGDPHTVADTDKRGIDRDKLQELEHECKYEGEEVYVPVLIELDRDCSVIVIVTSWTGGKLRKDKDLEDKKMDEGTQGERVEGSGDEKFGEEEKKEDEGKDKDKDKEYINDGDSGGGEYESDNDREESALRLTFTALARTPIVLDIGPLEWGNRYNVRFLESTVHDSSSSGTYFTALWAMFHGQW